MRLLAGALTAAGVDPTPEEWDAFAREERERVATARPRERRVDTALAAIIAAAAVAGVDTPGELLEKRGLATVPDLLASLGFTGDLEALAREIEASVSAMRQRQGNRN